jgi:hypothetical protein
MRLCGGATKGGTAPPGYGALRVILNLGTQQEQHDFINSTERFRVEVLTTAGWLRPRLVVECHGME